MREVFNDGKLGEKLEFKMEKILKSLEKENVNHVNVFKKENEPIEDMPVFSDLERNDLKKIIMECLKEFFNKKEIIDKFNSLTSPL